MKYICKVCGKIFDEEVIPYHEYPLKRMGSGAIPVLCVGSNMLGEKYETLRCRDQRDI